MKTKTRAIRKRNPVAKVLADPRFALKRTKNPKAYVRKARSNKDY